MKKSLLASLVVAFVISVPLFVASSTAYGDLSTSTTDDDLQDYYERPNYYLYVSTVTVNSKKIVITADEKCRKGDYVKVNIGKKTYKKKVKNGSRKISVKIKKQKVFQKIRVYLYDHAGRILSEPYKSKVYLSESPKLWYTMKQAKQTEEYSKPDLIWKKDRTYTFWMWFDGSTWVFKNGKLRAMK